MIGCVQPFVLVGVGIASCVLGMILIGCVRTPAGSQDDG